MHISINSIIVECDRERREREREGERERGGGGEVDMFQTNKESLFRTAFAMAAAAGMPVTLLERTVGTPDVFANVAVGT